ncbi:hypothetical protein [Azospirillum rugosum]|uniref:Flagellar basal body rod FlgEFG protein C-terminal n=1 Tax=Azospirillum rugosum TaxID=416170 RepID=A0ABS4SQF5_9PROT|nr:hypothetical protein [Azospirillum rugosum]MBP2294791.1 hypothetical protein [Azospirillum rugosum]MDQ0528287.1 hypothetical protein [Azospirillum rugosum]
MGISAIGAPSLTNMPLPNLPEPQASALAGLQGAQARAEDAGTQLAAGNIDPAVVVSLSSAQVDFAANVKVMQAADDNTKRVLDILA